jgi:hypothetical protein
VRTKDSCWSVETIYDPRELPGVSTAGPGIGRGVTVHCVKICYMLHTHKIRMTKMYDEKKIDCHA